MVTDGESRTVLIFLLVLFVLALPLDKLIYNSLLPISNSDFGTYWAHAADFAGSGLFLLISFLFIALFYAYFKKGGFWLVAISCGLALGFSGIFCSLIKIVVGRPRPGMELPSWSLAFFSTASDFHSFPSGHAAASFAVAFALGRFLPGVRPAFLIIAAVISIGRVIGQAHFMTDIIAGAIIGLVSCHLSTRVGSLASFGFISKE